MRHERPRRRAMERIAADAREGREPDWLFGRMFRALQAVLPVSSACWHLNDPLAGVITRTAAIGDPPGSYEEALGYEYARVAPLAGGARRPRPVAILSRETRGEPALRPRYREMLDPEGPATSCARAAWTPTARGARSPSSARGASRRRTPRWWPASRRSSPSRRSSAPGLPGAVHILAAEARRRDPLCPARPRARVAVVIQPAPAASLTETLLLAHGLTAREREIVTLVLAGRSTAAIAGRLHLSPWTVQDHLKAVFGKLGVNSRRALVARISIEAGRPANPRREPA